MLPLLATLVSATEKPLLLGHLSTCNAGDLSSIPRSGRSPRGGHGNPLQYSFLENPTDRGAWWATVRGVRESDTTEGLNNSNV